MKQMERLVGATASSAAKKLQQKKKKKEAKGPNW